jgi:hypothetical protein
MQITLNRLDPNVPDPVESRRRAAGRAVRIAYATVVFGILAFVVAYFAAPLVYLRGPGTVSAPRFVVSLPFTVQINQMKLAQGASVKAGDEIAQVVSPEQDNIVASFMRALADVAGRTAELRVKSRVAQDSRCRTFVYARGRGSSGTRRGHVHGHRDVPHGAPARARRGSQSRHLAGGGGLRVRHTASLPG